MNTIVTICAREGSRGLPGKNIRLLHGKPLIVHTIQQAKACPGVEGVYVSTDSAQIAEISSAAGAMVPYLRPAELATDTAPKVPVIEHLVNFLEDNGQTVDQVVDLDPTSPLRTVDDIKACLGLFGDDTDVVITGYVSDKNPYFNMVEVKPDGNVGVVKPPPSAITGRQGAPAVFSMNASIYVWRRAALRNGLWGGRVKLHVMPRERSIDIDTEFDFTLVERMMELQNAG
jgi:CMP-N,N'-diacetyllegionaminic acid synthase